MNRTQTTCCLLMFALVVTACDQGPSTGPTPPTNVQPPVSPPVPPPPPAGIELAGTVSDAAWRPLPGARVEVVDGPQAGLSTTAIANGEFRLTGAFDETTRFRATKDGHAPATFALPPICPRCNPNWWLHFSLESLAPHADISGDYALKFSAASDCLTLPEDARTRTYKARVALMSTDPTNSRFIVTVEDARFVKDYNQFIIGLAGDYLASDLGDLHGGPGLVEEIAPNTYLTFGGVIRGSVTDPSTIAAPLAGFVDRCELAADWGSRHACGAGSSMAHVQCGAGNHQLILTRR